MKKRVGFDCTAICAVGDMNGFEFDHDGPRIVDTGSYGGAVIEGAIFSPRC